MDEQARELKLYQDVLDGLKRVGYELSYRDNFYATLEKNSTSLDARLDIHPEYAGLIKITLGNDIPPDDKYDKYPALLKDVVKGLTQEGYELKGGGDTLALFVATENAGGVKAFVGLNGIARGIPDSVKIRYH